MSATELLAELTRLGIHLEARAGKLRYHPRSQVSAELVARLKAHKAGLLAILQPEAAAITPAPVYEGWIERVGPDGRVSLTHPDHLDDEYIDPPDLCPDCDSMESWWNPLGDRFCMKCDPPITAMRLRQLVAQLRNSCPGRPAAAATAGTRHIGHVRDSMP